MPPPHHTTPHHTTTTTATTTTTTTATTRANISAYLLTRSTRQHHPSTLIGDGNPDYTSATTSKYEIVDEDDNTQQRMVEEQLGSSHRPVFEKLNVKVPLLLVHIVFP